MRLLEFTFFNNLPIFRETVRVNLHEFTIKKTGSLLVRCYYGYNLVSAIATMYQALSMKKSVKMLVPLCVNSPLL